MAGARVVVINRRVRVGIVHGLFLFFLEILGLWLSLHRSHQIVDNFVQTEFNRIKLMAMINDKQ